MKPTTCNAMEIAWFLILSQWCITLVIGFDLGPMVRIGQCRSECLRRHSVDGSCDWYSNRGETVCSEVIKVISHAVALRWNKFPNNSFAWNNNNYFRRDFINRILKKNNLFLNN